MDMTPSSILSSSVVMALFVLVFAALLVGWAYSITLNLWDKKYEFGVGFLMLNPIIFWSMYEMFSLSKKDLGKMFWVYFLVNYLILMAPMCALPVYDIFNISLGYSCLGVVSCVVLLWLLASLSGTCSSWYDFQDLFRIKSFTHLVLCSALFWISLLSLIYYTKWMTILVVFSLAMFNDTMALGSGKLLGSHKLSMYSPGKTKEGMWIAMLLVLGGAAGVLFAAPLDTLQINLFESNENYKWVVLSLVFVALLLGNWGDLYFSMHKSVYGIKDYSGLLGKHGGFWDSFDSISFIIIFTVIITMGWSLLGN